MNNLIRLVGFTSLTVLLLAIIASLFRGANFAYVLIEINIWIAFFLVGLIGLFIGWLINYLRITPFPKPRKKLVYSLSIASPLIFLLGFLVFIGLADSKKTNHIPNSQSNYEAITDPVSKQPDYYLLKSLKRLENYFSDSNEFRLTGYTISENDTLLPNETLGTVRTTYFAYFLKDNDEIKYVSRVDLYNDTPRVIFHNSLAGSNVEYLQKKREINKSLEKTLNETTDALRLLADSLKNK
jgi:hypothetical protein